MCPPPSKLKTMVPPAEAVKPRRPRAAADDSPSLLRTAVFIGLYALVFTVGISQVENKGLRFHDDIPWMVAAVSWPVVYALPLVYAVAVMVGCRVMESRKSMRPFLKKYVQPVYNVAQIAVCSYMVWGLSGMVDWRSGNPFALNSEFSKKVEWLVFVHYLTKFMDWFDTLFMILSKSWRQVSFLQVFHHATIGMVWGALLCKGFGSGTIFYGAFINSVTHVIMYTHYLVTSFGVNNPFKRYITKFQLTQFASCYLHSILAIAYESNPSFVYLGPIQLMYHNLMLALFGRYMNWAPRWLHGQNIAECEAAAKAAKCA